MFGKISSLFILESFSGFIAISMSSLFGKHFIKGFFLLSLISAKENSPRVKNMNTEEIVKTLKP